MSIIFKNREGEEILIFSNFSNTGIDHPFVEFELIFKKNGFEVRRTIEAEPLDIEGLLKGLTIVYETLNWGLNFEPLSRSISFKLEIDTVGHINITGKINSPDYSTSLQFEFEADQSFLPELIAQCKEVLSNLTGYVNS